MLSVQGDEEYYGYSYNREDIIEDRDHIYDGSIFTTHHAIPRIKEKTIRHDLDKLGLPSNIVHLADDIYQKMEVGTKRGKRRKMLLFFCAFTAYNEENVPVDPIELANICGIDRSSISKSLSMCSMIHSDQDTPLIYYKTPKDCIPMFYNKLNDEIINFSDDSLDDIYRITDEVMTKDIDLKDEKPQTVAAAILVYYLWMNGYSIDKDKYKSIFGLSDMTINKIKKKVMRAYNE